MKSNLNGGKGKTSGEKSLKSVDEVNKQAESAEDADVKSSESLLLGITLSTSEGNEGDGTDDGFTIVT